MSNLEIGAAGVVGLLVVLFLRVPIGVALALVGVCGYAAVDGWRKALTMMGAVPLSSRAPTRSPWCRSSS